jgi:hypothetical protein
MLVKEEVKNFVDEFNIRNANPVVLTRIENDTVEAEFSTETFVDLFKDRMKNEMRKIVRVDKIEKTGKKIYATFSVHEKKSPVEEILNILKGYEGKYPRTLADED